MKLVLVAVALTAYVVDLVTKHLAVTRLADGDIPVFGDWFVLHLTRNPGAAFSTGTRYTLALSCLAVVAILVVLWMSRKIGDRWWAVGLGLLLGGVAGNFTDRLFREPGRSGWVASMSSSLSDAPRAACMSGTVWHGETP